MKLLHLNKCLFCPDCQMTLDVGFTCYQLEKEEEYQVDNSKSSCTLFLIEGEVVFDMDKYKDLRILQSQMMFIPQNEATRIKPMDTSKCVLLFWDQNLSVRDRLFLASLSIKELSADVNVPVLPIKKGVMAVLDSICSYLEVKLLCRHMHSLKQQELLLVLKGLYTKKELAAFFFESNSVKQHFFKRFVLENYIKVKTVKEFANLYCVSERSFNRKFHSYFGESPYKWMQKKKAEQIREMICNPKFTLQEIADKFEFSSSSYFTAYCRRMFGMTPSQLRENEAEDI